MTVFRKSPISYQVPTCPSKETFVSFEEKFGHIWPCHVVSSLLRHNLFKQTIFSSKFSFFPRTLTTYRSHCLEITNQRLFT